MKKIFIILMLGALLLGTMAFAQVRPVDTTLKAISPTGAALQLNSIVTVQVVLVHPLRMTNSAVFSYYGIDTGTGYGINIFANVAGGDSTILTSNPPGTREGLFVQCTGVIAQFNGNIEVDFTSGGASAITTLGTGFAHPTTVVPSLAVYTTFDQTLQSGGEFYEGRLVRINNVHVTSIGSFNSLNVSDFSGATVLLNSPTSASFATFTAANPTLYGTVTTPGYAFDFVGVATQASGNTGPYVVQWRYIATDFIPHFGVSPVGPIFTQPNAPGSQLTVFGGFPPYSWTLSTSGLGTLDTGSGATVTFSPSSTTGNLKAFVTDSAGESLSIDINITGTSAPLAPETAMESSVVYKVIDLSDIKPSEK